MFKTIAIINRALKENKKIITIPFNNNNIKIIKILYEHGYLFNYQYLYNKIIIEFNIYENNFIFNKLKSYENLENKKYITYVQLKRNVYKKKKILLLSTNNGLLLSDMAIKYHLGGYIIAEFI